MGQNCYRTIYLPFLGLTHLYLTIIFLLKLILYCPSLSALTPRRYVLANVALTCPAKQIASKERIVKFDTNAKPIRVDNQCSVCISPYIEDFVGPLEDTNKTIKGFAGAQTNNPKIATLHWQCLDDLGEMHVFEFPNSYYVPKRELRLLSPQHWAETRTPAD